MSLGASLDRSSQPLGLAPQLPVEFNPLLPEFIANPYPFYQRLQTEDPVHRSTLLPDSWILTRYADAAMVLRDPRFGRQDAARFFQERFGAGPVVDVYTKWMLFRDPPDHTRLRTLVSKAFTPRAIENLRPRIQILVDELLGAVQAAGQMDIMNAIAYPLPVLVICEMLGVPAKDRDVFQAWSGDVARTLDPIQTPETVARGHAVVARMCDYFRELIAELRHAPKDDLLSAMIVAEEQGDRLTEEELLANCILLFSAGHETTVNLIGNGMLALLRYPDQRKKLAEHPELIESAVEEFLRYEGPVQITGRGTQHDIEIGGKQIKAGERIFTILAAANRDPAQFPDPDRLDITRRESRHLAFGYGIHFCLGAALARLEAQSAINTMLRRMPRLALQTDTVQWRPAFTLRGLQELPVTF
ncbi:MAG: cytochrome P450 [Deltaproteobacteria bacterium]|nr:cytochrome P450 [Deltaproteobacteria bacterium]